MSTTTTDKGINRLVYQFSDSVNLINFLKAFLAETDELYDSAETLLDDRNLDTASGVQLDGIGEIVGVDRPYGYSDADYLLVLKAKIIINTTNMSVDSILNLFEFVFGSDRVRYYLPSNLNPYYVIAGQISDTEEFVFGLFPTTIGVGVTYISVPVYNEAFSFDGDSGLGFSDATYQDELLTAQSDFTDPVWQGDATVSGTEITDSSTTEYEAKFQFAELPVETSDVSLSISLKKQSAPTTEAFIVVGMSINHNGLSDILSNPHLRVAINSGTGAYDSYALDGSSLVTVTDNGTHWGIDIDFTETGRVDPTYASIALIPAGRASGGTDNWPVVTYTGTEDFSSPSITTLNPQGIGGNFAKVIET